MSRWIGRSLVLLVLFSVVSCGENPPQFTDKNQGYLDALVKAVKSKNAAQVEQACKNFQTRHDNFPKSVEDAELKWYMKVCQQAKDNKWDKAQATVDEIVKAQVTTSEEKSGSKKKG